MEKTKYYGIYTKQNKKIKYYTENLTPGISFFGEKLIKENDKEYRETNIRRSKLFAAVSKHISNLFLKKNNIVLYLGASHGYTPSFISDIVSEGYVFCLDFAPRVVRDLVAVCEKRENMIPILADAKKIDEYKDRIDEVDIIYQDIAQKNQVEILFKNLEFLKDKGYVLFTVKARSIDVTKHPKQIFIEVEKKLCKNLKIIDYKILDPYEKDHCFFVCQKIN
ncbi:fibrillarin-like rRNA/tRNA 2'-O-methyltransferase [Candidatus Woesearchaeota archaeon]|nr:fibrillarin-like rRNA/tRNA 2'-O-methyltransferase [Candidatus Woesearchaeota archaeon]